MKNIPVLKTHLQEEWDKEASRAKAKAERKRKLQEKRKDPEHVHEKAETTDDHVEKKQKISDVGDVE
jgi:aprataxin